MAVNRVEVTEAAASLIEHLSRRTANYSFTGDEAAALDAEGPPPRAK